MINNGQESISLMLAYKGWKSIFKDTLPRLWTLIYPFINKNQFSLWFRFVSQLLWNFSLEIMERVFQERFHEKKRISIKFEYPSCFFLLGNQIKSGLRIFTALLICLLQLKTQNEFTLSPIFDRANYSQTKFYSASWSIKNFHLENFNNTFFFDIISEGN